MACWIDRWLGEQKWDSPRLGAAERLDFDDPGRRGHHDRHAHRGGLSLPGEEWLGLVGLILVLGGGWCWWESAHGRRRRAATVFALTSVVFLTAVFGFAALRVDRHQNAKPMIAAIRADWGKNPSPPPIATYGLFRESTVFYAGQPVTRCSGNAAAGRSARQELADFIARHEPIVTSSPATRTSGRSTRPFPGCSR